jgi:hypothetical protein
MEKIKINFIFSAGFSCDSANYLKRYNLRKMSGPFDFMYIDFETTLKVIASNFEDYTSDIVVCNKHYQNRYLQNKKNTTEPHPRFTRFIENEYIGYISDNYYDVDLLVNQNYIKEPELPGNLYDWTHICIFFHHNIVNRPTREKIIMRSNRFMNIYEQTPLKTCLFHITKPLLETPNQNQYIESIIELKKKYKIQSYMIIFILLEVESQITTHEFKYDCLFIILTKDQYIGTDKGMEIVKQYFDIDVSENINEIGEFH